MRGGEYSRFKQTYKFWKKWNITPYVLNKFKCSFLFELSQLHAFASTTGTFVHTHLLRDLYLPLLPSAGMINWFHLRRQHWQIGSGCLDRHAENNSEAGNTTGEEECCDHSATFALNVKNGSGSTCVLWPFPVYQTLITQLPAIPSLLSTMLVGISYLQIGILTLYTGYRRLTRKSGYAE